MSEINRPYSAYLMDALTYSRNLRRSRQFALALQELYELIPDLEETIQAKLKDIEKEIEALYENARKTIPPGSEYSVGVEISEKIQEDSRKLLRKVRGIIMKELITAGYFEYEKGVFHDPSAGRGDETKRRQTAGFGDTVRRTL